MKLIESIENNGRCPENDEYKVYDLIDKYEGTIIKSKNASFFNQQEMSNNYSI